MPSAECSRPVASAESSNLRSLLHLLRCQTFPSQHSLAAGPEGLGGVPSSPNPTAPLLLGHKNTPLPPLVVARTAAAKALHPPVGHD